MKKILFVLVVLFMFACSDDTKKDIEKEKNPCDTITCESYETCDEGVCALNSGSCESNDNCKETNKTVCDLDTHLCKEKEIKPECTINTDCVDEIKTLCENEVCIEPVPECNNNDDCNENKPVCLDGTCIEESNCVGLSISGPQYYKNTYASGGYYVSYEETIETKLYLSIEFHESTPIGDYNLMSVGVNDNYETCMQCVLISDFRPEKEEEQLFFIHTSGTLKVTSGDAYLENSGGSISNIKLQEAVIDWDDTSHSALVDGGSCYEIELATWSN